MCGFLVLLTAGWLADSGECDRRLESVSPAVQSLSCWKGIINHEAYICFSDQLSLHCCNNQNVTLKFFLLNFSCCCMQRGEKQRPDHLMMDFQVGDVRTDCPEQYGCERRGLLFKRCFKSQLQTALIHICPVLRWSSVLCAGSSWRANLVFF